MKNIFASIIAILLTTTICAQSPQKMSYQAVIRDDGNTLVTNLVVGMQVSILQDSPSGSPVYVETQSPSTNANGLVSIEIGSGTPVTGTFAGIDWSAGTYFIKTETDPEGGTSYTITGTSQLLSVPYALHSKTADSITGAKPETDPVYSGSQAANISDGDITNLGNLSGVNSGDQQLLVSEMGDTLSLSNGNWVIIPGISAANSDAPLTVSDIDGNIYKTVEIGNQVWMAENLKTTRYADGTPITNGTLLGGIGYTDKYYFIYQNDPNYKDIYGLLYTWSATTNGVNGTANPSGVQGVCPDGWHVPSNAEKTELITYLGGSDIAGGKLKEVGTAHWNAPNTGATNESGFAALGTGSFFYQTSHRYEYGLIGDHNSIWTATTNANHVDQTTAYAFYLGTVSDDSPIDNSDNKGNGESVRCVKD